MKNTNLLVAAEQAGLRLDIFLSGQLGISRSQVHKMLADNKILVNDASPKKAGERVKEKDVVRVIAKSPDKIATTSQSHGIAGTKNKGITKSPQRAPRNDAAVLAPKIIAETRDYIIINKPSGLLVHPTMANEKNTLAHWLVKKYPSIKKVGDTQPSALHPLGRGPEGAFRPGIVHRLDKEASGLMVIARTQKMFEFLKEQFKNRTVEKEYLALVHGKVAKDWDEINFPIARGETMDRMAARPLLTKEGQGVVREGEKQAKTEFLVEKRFANCTFLRVILHTGRMHQIRVHMLAYNHPLVGDPLYNQRKRKRNLDEKLGRLFLHSTKLGFTDLKGEKQTFESPLPEQLQKFLGQLK